MKKHTNKTRHRHNNLIPPSSPHLFNTNLRSTTIQSMLLYPTLQFCVDGGRCDGVILYIGECKYILKAEFCCNWSVRCVVCVCCNFVLDRVRSGFVDVVRFNNY